MLGGIFLVSFSLMPHIVTSNHQTPGTGGSVAWHKQQIKQFREMDFKLKVCLGIIPIILILIITLSLHIDKVQTVDFSSEIRQEGWQIAKGKVGDKSFDIFVHDPSVDLYISGTILESHQFEPISSQRFVKYLTEYGGDVLDVGANIGWFSLLSASAGARVVAIEPLVYNTELLRSSIQKNKFQNKVNLYEYAVTAFPGNEVCLLPNPAGDPDRNSGNGQMQMSSSNCAEFATLYTIDAITSNHLDFHFNIFKIDIEGFESFAHRGGRRFLLEQRPCMIVSEYQYAAAVEIAGTRDLDWVYLFRTLGYSVQDAFNDNYVQNFDGLKDIVLMDFLFTQAKCYRPGETRIDPIIHFVKSDSDTFTTTEYMAVLSARRVYRPSSIHIWHTKPLVKNWQYYSIQNHVTFNDVQGDAAARYPSPEQERDIVGLKAIYDYGGILLDLDALAMRSLESIFDDSVIQNTPYIVKGGHLPIISPQGNKDISNLLTTLKSDGAPALSNIPLSGFNYLSTDDFFPYQSTAPQIYTKFGNFYPECYSLPLYSKTSEKYAGFDIQNLEEIFADSPRRDYSYLGRQYFELP